MSQPEEQKKRLKWYCYAAAALLGICLGLTWLAIPNREEEVEQPPAIELATVPAQTVPETQPQTEATLPPPAWDLVLVNPWNALPEKFGVKLVSVGNGQTVDARILSNLQDMMAAMKEEGLRPLICSSFRTQEKQEFLYARKVKSYLDQGYHQQEAESEAGKWVAVPGTSEHQTGLALDIVDESYPYLNEKQEDTAAQKWLMAHSWEYGFILRYPSDKSHITGIYYEPWHYRYVGKAAAKDIFEQEICLEEYVAVG